MTLEQKLGIKTPKKVDKDKLRNDREVTEMLLQYPKIGGN